MSCRLALAGNPNCGKTTLYNALTGSNQYVGNWPGVTVAKKVGATRGGRSELVDLPGIYSLSIYSMEEIVARDYLLEGHPDAIINIVDGTNLERNLYLTMQLLELGIPMVVAVNMMDELRAKGWALDCDALSGELGVPVIPVTARSGEHVTELLECAEKLANAGKSPLAPRYDEKAERALGQVEQLLGERPRKPNFPPRFLAGKLLEGDEDFCKRLRLKPDERLRLGRIADGYEQTSAYGDRETMLADARYKTIERVASACLNKGKGREKTTVTERIDRIVTGRFLALPVFFFSMFLMFSLTFGPIGKLLSGLVEHFFADAAVPLIRAALDAAAAPAWCYGLLLDAVIGGVSGILVFLPQIALLFLCLSLLEDSGYMARAAFIMDRLLRRLGLSGKSFIPMLMGFGCTTPAVMAARALENEKDRRMTMMLTPFMSCGARLPIYAMFAGVFFPERQGLAVFGMYVLGIVVAVLVGLALKHTLFRGDTAPFVLELPPYRLPLARSVALHVWEKVKGFLVKAGTLIFAMSVLIWLLRNFSPSLRMVTAAEDSMLGQFGSMLAPIFMPLGFGCWQAAVALLTGLIAKESVVSTLTILYAGGSAALLPAALGSAFSPASALAFMVFCLLYMPCISAFVTLCREMNSFRWALGAATLQTGVAYAVSFGVYRIAVFFLGERTAEAVDVLTAQQAALASARPVAVQGPAALICAGIAAVGVVLLLRGMLRALRGRCCTGCRDCRMREKCNTGMK